MAAIALKYCTPISSLDTEGRPRIHVLRESLRVPLLARSWQAAIAATECKLGV